MAIDPARAKSLFLAASDIADPAERAAYLDRECGAEAELRARVEALLRVNDASPLPESEPAQATGDYVAGAVADSASADPAGQDEQAGTVIAGKYTLVDLIGEGGMGSVWRAKQTEPVKRYVAVKLIKAGMDSRQVLARFEAERQALALMDHPNIAKVLDGGLHQHRPFFVMELVKGVPITDFCDARKLTPKERLELFVPVCQAIQHAHQKGIIHRDIKPSNVLIALYDDKPVVKVIDFGVAKATGGTLTEHTIETGIGGVVGTPQYMSPEQATFNNLDIDTRSDVYALGVLLYELLTGSPPFARRELQKAGLLEILRVVREEEPPRPSVKLSTADALPSLSANRGTEPKKLTGQLRNELDWIVMKALEKDRTRRYETANGFAADVLRYLSGEAVLAHPPSTAYRLKKFVKRYKGQVLAASVVFLALLAGIVGTTLGLLEAKRQEGIALAAAEEEHQAKLREAEQRTKSEKARDRTRQALDAMTSSVTGDSLTTQKEVSDEQKKFLIEVLSYYQEFAGEKADDEPSRARTAQAAYRVGTIQKRLGRKMEAAAAFRQARDRWEQLAAHFPAMPDYRHQLARNHNNLGLQLLGLETRPEAEKQFRRAMAIWQELAADFPTVPQYRLDLARSHHNLGLLLAGLGQPDAEQQYRQALAIYEKLAADFPAVPEYRRDLANSHNSLGMLLADLAKRSKAEQQYRQALAIQEKLAADFPAVPEYRQGLAMSHNNLGNLLAGLEKGQEAEQQYRHALAISEKLATDFPTVPEYRQSLAMSHNNLGNLLKGLGKRTEAEKQLRQALAILEKLAADFPTVPAHRKELADGHNNLGILLKEMGKGAEAEQQFRQALALKEKLAADFPTVPRYRQGLADNHNNLGALLMRERGKRPDAEQQFRKAVAIRTKLVADFPAVPEYRQTLAGSLVGLGFMLRPLGKLLEAEQLFRQALAIDKKLAAEFPAVPEYRKALANSHNSMGLLLADLKKWSEAETQFRQALALREKLAAEFPAVPQYQIDLGGSCCNFGHLLRTRGRANESLQWFDKAIRTLMAVHQQDRQLVAAKLFLRNSHTGRAVAYDRLHKYIEAVKDWDKAIELSPKREQPSFRVSRAKTRIDAGQMAEAVAEIAELTKAPNWNAGQWYTFACVYAVASGKSADKKQEYADRALELLHQAVRAGYNDAAHMKKDTDLDPIRARDDFKKLIETLAKKSPSTPEKQP